MRRAQQSLRCIVRARIGGEILTAEGRAEWRWTAWIYGDRINYDSRQKTHKVWPDGLGTHSEAKDLGFSVIRAIKCGGSPHYSAWEADTCHGRRAIPVVLVASMTKDLGERRYVRSVIFKKSFQDCGPSLRVWWSFAIFSQGTILTSSCTQICVPPFQAFPGYKCL